jgi:REP element-mobilizing transposase RayT
MNRGRRSENIFSDKKDYLMFINVIKESVKLWNVRVAAYCLMPNHYHMLIQTPDANLSRCMRHINGVYTQRYNRFYDCDGQMFRGRYQSILVDADSYLLQLVRYIHRNPLKAGLAEKLNSYAWSSHKGYLSDSKQWNWLYKDFILSQFSRDKTESQKKYNQFVSLENLKEIEGTFNSKKLPPFLGSDHFVSWVKETFYHKKRHEEVPGSRLLAPDPEHIKEIVSQTYQIEENILLKSRKGVFNEPRNVAIYLMRRLRGDSLVEIGKIFQMKKYSSVSSIIERLKAQMAKDRNLRKRVKKLESQIIKSQEQT